MFKSLCANSGQFWSDTDSLFTSSSIPIAIPFVTKWAWLKSLSRKLAASIPETINCHQLSLRANFCNVLWVLYHITKWFWFLAQKGPSATPRGPHCNSQILSSSEKSSCYKCWGWYHLSITLLWLQACSAIEMCNKTFESQSAKLFESLAFGKLRQFSNPKYVWHGEVSEIDNLP